MKRVTSIPRSALAMFTFAAISLIVPTAQATIYWELNPSRGDSQFEGVEKQPGRSGTATDPKGTYGTVYWVETFDSSSYPDKERCEAKGCRTTSGANWRPSENGEYYLGWRALWNPLPTVSGRWTALFQLKGGGAALFPVAGGNGCPIVLRTLGDGKLYMQLTCSDNGHVWSTSLIKNAWNKFVIRMKLTRSKSTGYVELWYNGVKQTFNLGSKTQRQPAALWETEYCRSKFGVYRTGAVNGTARAYLSRIRWASSYSEAAP